MVRREEVNTKVFFEVSYLLHLGTQRIFNYQHNGKDIISSRLNQLRSTHASTRTIFPSIQLKNRKNHTYMKNSSLSHLIDL